LGSAGASEEIAAAHIFSWNMAKAKFVGFSKRKREMRIKGRRRNLEDIWRTKNKKGLRLIA
jgi:hypothetical protein